jgi:recombination protein RecA
MAAKGAAAKKFKCPEPGCDYSAKTQGAVTQHVNKKHSDDPSVKLANQFGTSAPRPGGLRTIQNQLVAVPSGIPSFDYASGIGGIPRGRMIEIFGPPAAGKTFVALTFSAHAQQNGGVAGFMDAERALQETFTALIPGLDVEKLQYGQAHGGEEALEITKQYIMSGGYDIWTIDSLRACVPSSLIDIPIGAPAAQAALARLLSDGMPVLDQVISDTKTTLVLVNHEKEKPGVRFGDPTYTPGGTAVEYHSAMRLRVWASTAIKDKDTKRQIGHKVKVKVRKSKVAAPMVTAEFDLYYHPGVNADTNREVLPGVDIGSSWLDICVQENLLTKSSSGTYIDLETGVKLGTERDMVEAMTDPRNEYVAKAREAVYPEKYRDG